MTPSQSRPTLFRNWLSLSGLVIAIDSDRQKIPWVRLTDPQGVVTVSGRSFGIRKIFMIHRFNAPIVTARDRERAPALKLSGSQSHESIGPVLGTLFNYASAEHFAGTRDAASQFRATPGRPWWNPCLATAT
jgi:hypothetical protein